VGKIRDFNRDTLRDEEGDGIPREKMLFVELEDGRSFAVRPSGTEPKIKYYLFGRQLPPSGGTLDAGILAAAKAAVGGSLASLWDWLEADITRRLA
jgi:phosphoglucomutase